MFLILLSQNKVLFGNHIGINLSKPTYVEWIYIFLINLQKHTSLITCRHYFEQQFTAAVLKLHRSFTTEGHRLHK